MQPVLTAITEVRRIFYGAFIRSLRQTKSLLQTIVDFWALAPIFSHFVNGRSQNGSLELSKDVGEFLEETAKEFQAGCTKGCLRGLSDGMRKQFHKSLLDSPFSMLPSYNHLLPIGNECGTFLALDVGGSTFRVALIELLGEHANAAKSKVSKILSFRINHLVKDLKGELFFDWMAARIQETLAGEVEATSLNSPLSTGLAWSFPIEQTSLRSGRLQVMGKGFKAAEGILGRALDCLIEEACVRAGLSIQLKAIVNDSSATLLSKAYLEPTTNLALILGTGVNAAIYLPLNALSDYKFGARPQKWYNHADHVIVNTELSMFGMGYLPLTRWDKSLLSTLPDPTFQPLEYLVGGYYLGETVRLALIEGIRTAGLFGGVVPYSLEEPYSLDTETISHLESDLSPTLASALPFFLTRHPTISTSCLGDIQILRSLATHISHRASSLVAASVHALWCLRNEAEGLSPASSGRTLVAYNGSVMESYPGFRARCQEMLDELVAEDGAEKGAVRLVYAAESSLLGAAVAVGVSLREEKEGERAK